MVTILFETDLLALQVHLNYSITQSRLTMNLIEIKVSQIYRIVIIVSLCATIKSIDKVPDQT